MPKPERGLPKSFDIKVPKDPVELGDYLDDAPPIVPKTLPQSTESATDPLAQIGAVVPPPPEPTATAVPPQTWTPPTYSLPSLTPSQTVVRDPPSPTPVQRSTRGKQRQFNMAPETLRMLEEALTYMRANSAERDLRASEVMHGLVLALHGALPYLDLARIPQRGKWGSATATALPVALKQMFESAFARKA